MFAIYGFSDSIDSFVNRFVLNYTDEA